MPTTKESGWSENKLYKFPGVSAVQVAENGAITLSWEKIESTENVNYAVFRREKTGVFDYKLPLTVVGVASYTSAPYSLDKEYCFAVRYQITNIEADSNTNEICPNIPVVSGYAGVASDVASGQGSVLVKWNAPTASKDISGYSIYTNLEFSNVIDSASADSTEKLIAGLPVDSVATLGVRG